MFGIDKQLHFLISLGLMLILNSMVGLGLAIILTLTIGLIKEVYDGYYEDCFCVYDLVANIAGVLVAIFLLTECSL